MRKTLCIIVLLAAPAAANAAWGIPAPPDWWQVPPDGATRLQHHSFHADPNLNQPPDSTYDGFVPSVPDQWTMPPGVGPQDYNMQNPSSWGFYWEGGPVEPFLNDNIGLTLSQAGTLTKQMGNLADDNEIKEFYALVIWTGLAGQLNISVSSPGTTVTTFPYEGGEAGMLATIIEGTIEPQPDFEDFSFAFSAPVFVDEIYIGTHCTPEPATLSLLALGGLAVLRRRRKQ